MAMSLRRKVLNHAEFGKCVLLPKTAWAKVPGPGRHFLPKVNGRRCRARVVSEECNCRSTGVHEHRFLKLPPYAWARVGQYTTIETP